MLSSSDPIKARQFIMAGLLQGYPPFTSTIRRPFSRWVLDELKSFGREDLRRYRFLRAGDRPVDTGRETVFASLWYRKGGALVYIGNFSERSARGSFRFNLSHLGKTRGKLTVTKLSKPGGKGLSKEFSRTAFKREGVMYSLKPWGSALYRIEA